MTIGPPSNPPGMPPPSHSGRRGSGDRYDYYGSSTEASSSDEVRILDILTKETGGIPLTVLYRLSGLTSDRFRFWLDELEKRGVIETETRSDDDYVALKGKLDHAG
jgi:hypothetical protein